MAGRAIICRRWREYYRQAQAAAEAEEDPAGEAGFRVVERWMKLTRGVLGHRQAYDGMFRALQDKQNWPLDLQQRLAEFRSALRPYQLDDKLSAFLVEAFRCHRAKFYDDATWESFYGGPLR